MPKIIYLPCDYTAGDQLVVSVFDDDDRARGIDINVQQQGVHHHVVLSMESARELFNWLGVWLHGG